MNNDPSSSVVLLIKGAAACFRRAEFTSDLVTYDIMPPTVANRMVSASLPGWNGRVTRIGVLNHIVRRWQTVTTTRGMKRCQILQDVAYVVEAEQAIGRAMARRQVETLIRQADVHLGLADFRACVSLVSDGEASSRLSGTGTIDLGWMPYDLNGASRSSPRFFRAVMHNGVLDIPAEEVAELAS